MYLFVMVFICNLQVIERKNMSAGSSGGIVLRFICGTKVSKKPFFDLQGLYAGVCSVVLVSEMAESVYHYEH